MTRIVISGLLHDHEQGDSTGVNDLRMVAYTSNAGEICSIIHRINNCDTFYREWPLNCAIEWNCEMSNAELGLDWRAQTLSWFAEVLSAGDVLILKLNSVSWHGWSAMAQSVSIRIDYFCK